MNYYPAALRKAKPLFFKAPSVALEYICPLSLIPLWPPLTPPQEGNVELLRSSEGVGICLATEGALKDKGSVSLIDLPIAAARLHRVATVFTERE